MWAHIENDRVIEITDIDPAGRFHPDLIWIEYDPAETDVHQGWHYSAGGGFTEPSDLSEVPMG